MITILTGGNDYESKQALAGIIKDSPVQPERIDGSTVTLDVLPNLLMGISLFAEDRLVIIDELSSSSAVWSKLPDWIPRLNDTIHLVLLEPSLDKRTSTYKTLKSTANIIDSPTWGPKDTTRAETWAVHYAKEKGVVMSRQVSAHLVSRVGLDQWTLAKSIDVVALSGIEEVSVGDIDNYTVPSIEENAFQLLDDAFGGRSGAIKQTLEAMRLVEEPHRLMALILGQVFYLAAVSIAPEGSDAPKDFGIHPFVASKLSRLKNQLGGGVGIVKVIELSAQADTDIKSSKADPWVIVEVLLLKIARRDY